MDRKASNQNAVGHQIAAVNTGLHPLCQSGLKPGRKHVSKFLSEGDVRG